MADFNFYLNRQGVKGRKGDQGEQGFSPIITVKTQTASEYVLNVQNEDGSFDTPNLRGNAIENNGGTYVRYNPETEKMYTGYADYATATQSGVVLLSTYEQLAAGGSEDLIPTSADVYDLIQAQMASIGQGYVTQTEFDNYTTATALTLNSIAGDINTLNTGKMSFTDLVSSLVAGNNITLTTDTENKIITIDAAGGDLSNYVDKTTDQTIDGWKTFLKSPILKGQTESVLVFKNGNNDNEVGRLTYVFADNAMTLKSNGKIYLDTALNTGINAIDVDTLLTSTSLTNYVTTNTAQNIAGLKTFQTETGSTTNTIYKAINVDLGNKNLVIGRNSANQSVIAGIGHRIRIGTDDDGSHNAVDFFQTSTTNFPSVAIANVNADNHNLDNSIYHPLFNDLNVSAGNGISITSTGSGAAKQYTMSVKVDGTTVDFDTSGNLTVVGGGATVDQTFDGTSANAQSGVAIAGELASYALSTSIPTDTSDLTNGAGYISSTTVRNIVTLTQQQYDALVTPDPNTEYHITDAVGNANVNLSNLSPAGKIAIAHNAVPSDKYDNLTLGASGTTYTMLSDGYLQLAMTSPTTAPSDINIYVNGLWVWSAAAPPYYTSSCNIPVKKGDVLTISYTATTLQYFRFVYAVGSESEWVDPNA